MKSDDSLMNRRVVCTSHVNSTDPVAIELSSPFSKVTWSSSKSLLLFLLSLSLLNVIREKENIYLQGLHE